MTFCPWVLMQVTLIIVQVAVTRSFVRVPLSKPDWDTAVRHDVAAKVRVLDGLLQTPPGSSTRLGSASANVNDPTSQGSGDLVHILQKCANQRSAEASDVISVLEQLEQSAAGEDANSFFKGDGDDFNLATAINGKFELIFSSAVAKLPIFGNMLGGYMPNREIITFDLQEGEMSLVVEILPFLPLINVYGDSLTLNDDNATLEYVVRGKEGKPPSQWKILYADDEIVAARSSVTGLNVIRRL